MILETGVPAGDGPSADEQAAFWAEIDRLERLRLARETMARGECPWCGLPCSVVAVAGGVLLRCQCRR